jgi:integrase
MRSYESAVARALLELRKSPLAHFADHYAAALGARRLAKATVNNYLRATLQFARWLKARPRGGPAIGEADVRAFITHLRNCRAPQSVVRSGSALNHLLHALSGVPGWTETPRPQSTPVDEEIKRFDAHLRDVCGLSPATRLSRTVRARELLAHLFGSGPVRHGEILPEVLGRFVVARTRHLSPGTAAGFSDAMRTYLRFLAFNGLCPEGLADAVPHVLRRRLATIPNRLREGDFGRFLRAFDRGSPRSRRDYAMALCLALLALRASEVAALRLGDIDWRDGTLTVASSKTRRGRVLPLPRRVGQALAAYLRVRPRSGTDRVFVYIGPREGEPATPSLVRCAARLAYRRAGFPRSYTGTHLLRHTAATRLVSAGSSVKEVADLLGHVSLDSTAIYAKVDLPRLRAVAQPWPEVS